MKFLSEKRGDIWGIFEQKTITDSCVGRTSTWSHVAAKTLGAIVTYTLDCTPLTTPLPKSTSPRKCCLPNRASKRRSNMRDRSHRQEFKLEIVRQLACGEKRPAQV